LAALMPGPQVSGDGAPPRDGVKLNARRAQVLFAAAVRTEPDPNFPLDNSWLLSSDPISAAGLIQQRLESKHDGAL